MQRKYQFKVSLAFFLCVVIFIGNGCTPLRKKFTRKKKQEGVESQKFIPVLEPIDYPDKVYTAQDRYKKHYALWKVWNRDFLQTVDSNGSDKRQKYLLGQVIEELSEMKKWLTDEQQAGLGLLIDDLGGVLEVYEKPVSMRNKFSIKKQVELTAKEIRSRFATEVVFPYNE